MWPEGDHFSADLHEQIDLMITRAKGTLVYEDPAGRWRASLRSRPVGGARNPYEMAEGTNPPPNRSVPSHRAGSEYLSPQRHIFFLEGMG